MTFDEGIERIEELIDEFGEEKDEVYLDLLSEMSARATDAFNARQEEISEEK